MDSENIGLYKYGSKKIKELNLDLWEKINNVLFDVSFKEKFYIIENSLIDIPKCECGNSVKFIDMMKGYREFCSRRCMYDSEKIKNKRKDTCVDKYGVDNPSKVKEVRDKVISTNLDKFGHEWATKSEDIKIIIKDKFIEKYGVDNPSKVKEVRDKVKMTMLDRYGVEYAMHSDEIKNKVVDKFIDKYNVDNPSKVKEVRDKAKMTMLDRYGVEYAMQNKSIKDKCKKNSIEKYGVDNPLKSNKIREKIKKTNVEKYGVDNPFASDIIKEKIKKTNIEKYGSINPFASDIIKEKIKKTNVEKYGYDHISKNSNYREKYNITTHSNYLNYIKDGVSLFSCDKGEDHNFEIYIDNYIKRINSGIPICTICNPIGDLKSIKEKELYLYINNIYDGNIIQSYRDVLEIDIYLPELKIGFEFNGLYWHSDLKKEKDYHQNKTKYFAEKGIRIIHIWEDDWTFKQNIIKSQLKTWIGINNNKFMARKCEVKLVTDIKETREFLNTNHIQGYVNNNLSIGLYYDGVLISIMTFDNFEGRKKMLINEWNLNRFCNILEGNVVGAASKLLKYFIDNYQPKRIISYADKDWSVGNLYFKLGFNKIGDSNPDYKYVVNDRRVHKSRYKKSNLKVSDMSESEYIKKENIGKIWDCGKLKFEMILE
jgi:hypothetical protein